MKQGYKGIKIQQFCSIALLEKSVHWSFNAIVGIFSQSYTVVFQYFFALIPTFIIAYSYIMCELHMKYKHFR